MSIAARLLLVEDDSVLASSLVKVLAGEGYTLEHASSGDQAWHCAQEKSFDLVITDLRLPGLGGLELLDRLHRSRPRVPVVLITAHGTADTAIEATRRGAYDFLIKPFAMPDLLGCVARALSQTRHTRRDHAPTPATDEHTLLIGRSTAMQQVFKEIGRVAAHPVTVLIRGETGTGKEMVARALWRHSGREQMPFLAINCAAIPENLLESELFGHEKGAFTGAETRRIGRFEQADGGTLFLDEIGDVPLSTQVKLLRILQDQVIYRVGGREPITVDVRILAATHHCLEDELAEGRFREDLFYRLNAVQIFLPPLRERLDDIPGLATFLAERHAAAMNLPGSTFTPDAIKHLQQHDWPGNVRELENVVKKCLLQARGFVISSEMIDAALVGRGRYRPCHGEPTTLAALVERHLQTAVMENSGNAYDTAVAELEVALLRRALAISGGNQTRAASLLGLSRLTLREKMQRHLLRPLPGGGK
jgi:nitrogen regulation protein NR(I)